MVSRDLTRWELYYRGGALVSCPMGGADGYDLEVRAAWETFFQRLPEGALIIDVATGNGAVALIASEVGAALGRGFDIHGVDLANIDPLKDAPEAAPRLAGVRFHPGVAAEALPFADGSARAVVSQYGVEYTDVERTFAEMARVLASDGEVQLIAHHAESIVVEKARATAALGAKALDELALIERTRAFLEAERTQPARAAELHLELGRLAAQLRAAAAESVEPRFADVTLGWLARVFDLRASSSPHESAAQLEAVERTLRAWLARMRDLLDAAWSEEDMRRAQRYAAHADLIARSAEPQFHRGSNLVGWLLRFSKS